VAELEQPRTDRCPDLAIGIPPQCAGLGVGKPQPVGAGGKPAGLGEVRGERVAVTQALPRRTREHRHGVAVEHPQLVRARHGHHHLAVPDGEVPRRRQVRLQRRPGRRVTRPPDLAGAGDRLDVSRREVERAQQVVAGVGNEHVATLQQRHALRLGEARPGAVPPPTAAGADPTYDQEGLVQDDQ
jgi:hypothetical protein